MRRLLLFAIVLTLFAMPALARRRAVTPGGPSHCVLGTLQESMYAQLLAADEQYIYILSEFSLLLRVPKLGGEAEILFLGFFDWLPLSMTVDANNIYMGALPQDAFFSPKPGAILTIPKTGGMVSVLVSGVATPFDIAVDATHVYWSAAGTFDFPNQSIAADGKIERARKDGTGRETLAENLSAPLGLALDGNDVYFGETGIAEGDPSVGLYRVAKTGGAITTINGATAVGPVIVDGNTIVMVGFNQTVGGVLALEKNGASEMRLLHSTEIVNGSPQVIDRRVYFLQESAGAGNELVWVNIDTPAPPVVAVAELDGDEFLVDGCAAIVNTVDGDVVRTRR